MYYVHTIYFQIATIHLCLIKLLHLLQKIEKEGNLHVFGGSINK